MSPATIADAAVSALALAALGVVVFHIWRAVKALRSIPPPRSRAEIRAEVLGRYDTIGRGAADRVAADGHGGE